MEPANKSRFVTNLALFSIVVAVFMIYQDSSTLSMLNSMNSRPEFKLAEQMLPTLSVSPTETILDIFMQCAGIIASIGLFNRLNWGRMMYMAVLSIITIMGIISSVSSYLSLSQYLNAFGMGGSLSLIILGSVLALGVNIYIVWKLSTREIRNEFLQ